MYTHKFTYNTGTLQNDLSDAVGNSYIEAIEFNTPWCAYKEWCYSLYSFGPNGSRFTLPGQPAYFAGSGDFCCEVECRGNISGKLRVPVGPITINAFNLSRFAKDYAYDDLFIQSGSGGGYEPPRFAKQWLHENHNISGILYRNRSRQRVMEAGWA